MHTFKIYYNEKNNDFSNYVVDFWNGQCTKNL